MYVKKRKSRKLTTKVSTSHKKLFLDACAKSDDDANLALEEFKHLQPLEPSICDEKFRNKLCETVCQGISDAIINENFHTAELLLVHLKENEIKSTKVSKEFSYRQILLALFMVMKNKNSREIEDLSEKFIPKIFDLDLTQKLHNKNLARIATKTIPAHGLSFCRHVLETICRDGTINYGEFEKVFEFFSVDDALPIVKERVYENWTLLYLKSENVSLSDFCKLNIAYFNIVSTYSHYYYKRAWTQCGIWLSEQKDVAKTSLLLEKFCFLHNTDPQSHPIDYTTAREKYTWDFIREAIDDNGNSKDLLLDDGFTIKNFLLFLQRSNSPCAFLTDTLQGQIKFDHNAQCKLKKRYLEIINWYATTITETTGIYFDVAKIIVDLVIFPLF